MGDDVISRVEADVNGALIVDPKRVHVYLRIDDLRELLAHAHSNRDAVEAAWREGWLFGYGAGTIDSQSDKLSWCDKERDWQNSKTRKALDHLTVSED